MCNSSRCAACKSLRRRCRQDCVLAPYFPSTNPQRFACVHKVFGASNISRVLQQLPVHVRADAADCMSFEAVSRVGDPVYGCVGIISQLRQQILQVQCEIEKTYGDIAFYSAQQQQLAQTQDQHGELSWFSESQQQLDPFRLDQQQFANFYQHSHV